MPVVHVPVPVCVERGSDPAIGGSRDRPVKSLDEYTLLVDDARPGAVANVSSVASST